MVADGGWLGGDAALCETLMGTWDGVRDCKILESLWTRAEILPGASCSLSTSLKKKKKLKLCNV